MFNGRRVLAYRHVWALGGLSTAGDGGGRTVVKSLFVGEQRCVCFNGDDTIVQFVVYMFQDGRRGPRACCFAAAGS